MPFSEVKNDFEQKIEDNLFKEDFGNATYYKDKYDNYHNPTTAAIIYYENNKAKRQYWFEGILYDKFSNDDEWQKFVKMRNFW